jgi:hypothetical protein
MNYEGLIGKAELLEQAALRARDCEVKLLFRKKANELREQAINQPVGGVSECVSEFYHVMIAWFLLVIAGTALFGILASLLGAMSW